MVVVITARHCVYFIYIPFHIHIKRHIMRCHYCYVFITYNSLSYNKLQSFLDTLYLYQIMHLHTKMSLEYDADCITHL